MANRSIFTKSVNRDDGVNYILALRNDLSRTLVNMQVTRLTKESPYSLSHWLGVCKRCAVVGDPMPWEA